MQGEMGYMKKYLIILTSFFLFLCLMFCGCFQQTAETDSEKIIGTWIAEESNFRMYKFFKNGTCLINDYEAKGTYYIKNDETVVINQTSPSVSYVYKYYINPDGTKLVLSNDEAGDYYTFRRKK